MGPKYIRFIELLIVLFLTGCGTTKDLVAGDTIDYSDTYDKTLQQVISEKMNPDLLGLWIANKVEYRLDVPGEEEFHEPEFTLARGFGDCDDYARLSEYIFDKQGIEAHILIFQSPRGCHAITWTPIGIMSNYTWCPVSYPLDQAYKAYQSEGAELIAQFDYY